MLVSVKTQMWEVRQACELLMINDIIIISQKMKIKAFPGRLFSHRSSMWQFIVPLNSKL